MHVTVAAVVQRDNKFLFVEETVGAQTVLNQPAGHWEAGESLIEAACRETLEESGWDIEPTALLAIYEYQPKDLGFGFLRFAFKARPLRHHPQRPLDHGIARTVWLTPAELRQQRARHRSPMVQQCVDDFLTGREFPLTAVRHL